VSRLADADARAEALDLGRHVLTVAPAGSGKTGLLVQRLLAALATVDEPEQVLAITFTNKAAAEIRERVLDRLEQAAAGVSAPDAHQAASLELARAALARDAERGWRLLESPDRLQATTIDSFNARIAGELPLLSGLGGRLGVSEDARGLYEDAVLGLFESALSAQSDPELREAAAVWLRSAGNRIDRLLGPLGALLGRRDQWAHQLFGETVDDDALLAALHRERQQAFLHALGRDDARRLLDSTRLAGADPDRLAWANALADWPEPGPEQAEAWQKLAALLVTQGGALRKPRGVDVRLGYASKSAAKQAICELLTNRADDAALTIAAARVQALPPAQYPDTLIELRDQLRRLLQRALAELRLVMGGRGETDFTEIALAALEALRPEGAYGDALLRRDASLRHLLVDEMQDTSEAQIELLRQLTQGWEAGDGRSLFLVGDPQQSIYGFRKAEVRLFLELIEQRRIGPLPLHVARLTTNFRSQRELVAGFNHCFAQIFPPADDAEEGVVAYRAADPAPTADDSGQLTFHGFVADDAGAEAEAVAQRAEDLLAQGHGDLVILAAGRRQLRPVLQALQERGIEVACQDIDPLHDTPAVRDLVACALALWHPEDRLHWAVLLRAPWVGFSWADLLALSRGARGRNWLQRLRGIDPAELSAEGRQRRERFLAALDAVEARAGDGLVDRVQALWLRLDGPACLDAVRLVDARRALTLLRAQEDGVGLGEPAVLRRALEGLYAATAGARVQAMTIHKAKGLEFDHVLLVGCGSAGRGGDKPLLHLLPTGPGPLLVPKPPGHWSDVDREPAERLYDYVHQLQQQRGNNETLRLLYVAMTRARRTLDVYLTLKPTRDDREPKPASHSLAACLWPVIADLPLYRDERPPPEDAAARPPRASRLPLDYVAPALPAVMRPLTQRRLRPSEQVLSTPAQRREDADEGDDLYARLVGTLFHQAMAKLTDEGIESWLASPRETALAAGLRRLGLPENRVDEAVARVLDLVRRSLASDDGRWLLGAHPWARSEYALAGWRGGEWVGAAIDRCLEDREGRLWVIDYKVRARPLESDREASYIDEIVRRYAPQLALYAELLMAERGAAGQAPTAAPRQALFLPEPGRLITLD
jgi:ATP-dependent exoDNAse (exonuclease V) beta subunit (contains helicase and exonuclease domains)